VHRHAFQDRVGGGAMAVVEVQVVDGQNVHDDCLAF
jgi:hypothetical protein